MSKRKKKEGPPPKVYKIPVGKGGRKSIAALLPLVDHKDLGISRSYYNKLAKKAREGQPMPAIWQTKIETIRNSRNKHVIALTDGYTPKVVVEPYLKKILSKDPKKGFIWVKFKLGSAGRIYNQSFTTSVDNIKNLSAQINKYLSVNVKKYDKFPVYVYEIAVQNV